MNIVYCYSGLLASVGLLFTALKANEYAFAFIVATTILFIGAKLYQFQGGGSPNETYKNLPILKFLAFIFKDKGILNSQSVASLSVLTMCITYVLSMIIAFLFFAETTRHFLLWAGCISFSVIFSKIYLRRYVQSEM